MQRGDLVEAKYMPHLGVGVIERVEPDTSLLVSFEVEGEPYSDDFSAHELRPAKPLVARTA
jgi:hypothetical protein